MRGERIPSGIRRMRMQRGKRRKKGEGRDEEEPQ